MEPTEQASIHRYHGMRYIVYARCAAADGAAVKLQEQVHQARQFADRLGMHCVDEIRLAGIGGGPPTLRDDLRQLLARKRAQDDFEVLVTESPSRLTRTGAHGCAEIEYEFSKLGVNVLYLPLKHANAPIERSVSVPAASSVTPEPTHCSRETTADTEHESRPECQRLKT